jgi:hypothetical protein
MNVRLVSLRKVYTCGGEREMDGVVHRYPATDTRSTTVFDRRKYKHLCNTRIFQSGYLLFRIPYRPSIGAIIQNIFSGKLSEFSRMFQGFENSICHF